MKNKIAFEEHFATEDTLEQTRPYAGDSGQWDVFARRLLDLGDERLDGMARNGIEFAILSLNSPGAQAIPDKAEALRIAMRANDTMADAVFAHPDHYAAFAALPMHDPDVASEELTRCVRELGFKGAMLNGFQQKDTADSAFYYDFPEYRSFWATVSELDVPVYLHPRLQIPSQAYNYAGHPWLMSAPWGFAVETSIHALRLCGSGIFDEYPNLRIVLGHLGENIPYGLSPRAYRGKRLLGEYFRDHFHITTSGNFSDPAFRCALEIMGADRLYFSADYPFEAMEDGACWFDATTVINEEERLRIGRTNAIELFGLELDTASPAMAASR